jgi:methyl-accepting chemotaxis protein
MDQVTQQNAALVEESAGASESLRTQAQRLVQAVSVFRLAQGRGEAAAVVSEVMPYQPAPSAARPAMAVKPRAAAAQGRAGRPGFAPKVASKPAASLPRPEMAEAGGDADNWQSF